MDNTLFFFPSFPFYFFPFERSNLEEEAYLLSEGNSTGCQIRNPDVTIGASFGCGLSLKCLVSGMPPLTVLVYVVGGPILEKLSKSDKRITIDDAEISPFPSMEIRGWGGSFVKIQTASPGYMMRRRLCYSF